MTDKEKIFTIRHLPIRWFSLRPSIPHCIWHLFLYFILSHERGYMALSWRDWILEHYWSQHRRSWETTHFYAFLAFSELGVTTSYNRRRLGGSHLLVMVHVKCTFYPFANTLSSLCIFDCFLFFLVFVRLLASFPSPASLILLDQIGLTIHIMVCPKGSSVEHPLMDE